MTTTYADEVN
jgi:dynein heavy chain